MKSVIGFLSSLSDTTCTLALTGIFLVASVASYFVYSDTRLLEKKIAYKKKEISVVLDLRQRYETKRKGLEQPSVSRTENRRLSLASLEALITTTFVGGRLVGLRPASTAPAKGKPLVSLEVKITGAPLGEVVNFLKSAGDAGFSVNKLQLTVPPNQATFDMQAVVTEGRVS